jgi:phage shock protein PspC (stress-responsive transcriptional regulator)
MNKVQQINLGGVPFTIDEDAFEHLSRYLKAIHKHFEPSEGYEEITNDIEARMAELFQESMGERPIVTIKDVEEAIVIMGTPEDFGAESLIDEEAPKTEGKNTYRTGKRLFRHPEDEVVGGVCAGIAAYFGINDPLWVRLAFIIFTISGGFGIPAYLILWVVLPKAETASDRLAMRGESINASNIGRIIEEEIEHLSNKVSELGNELSGKKKGLNGTGSLGEVLRQAVIFVGKVIRVVIDVISQLWKPLLIIIGGALIIATTISWISTVIGVIFAWPLLEFFTTDQTLLSMLGAFNILAIIGMIMLALVLFIYRLLYGTRMSSTWRTGLTAFWVLNIISFFMVASFSARAFSHGSQMEDILSLDEIRADTVHLKLGPISKSSNWFNIDDELKLVDDGLASRMVRLEVEKAESDVFELLTEFKARGYSSEAAKQTANEIRYQVQVEGQQITIPAEVITPYGKKWRVQEVTLKLKVPVGKAIKFAPEIHRPLSQVYVAESSGYFWSNLDKTWVMTEEGLICPACPIEAKEDNTPDYQGFNQILIEGLIKANISQGNEYKVRLTGEDHYKEQVTISQDGDVLSVVTDLQDTDSPLRLQITMPELLALNMENTDDCNVWGFHGNTMHINVKGEGYELKPQVELDSLYLVQDGKVKVDLKGRVSFLDAMLDNGTRLDAEKAAIEAANITAKNNSKIDLDKVQQLNQDIDESSDLDVNF